MEKGTEGGAGDGGERRKVHGDGGRRRRGKGEGRMGKEADRGKEWRGREWEGERKEREGGGGWRE